jgi:hypothetical protein
MASFESSQTCWVCWVELDKSTNGFNNFKLDGDRFATMEKRKQEKKKRKSLTCDFTFDSNFLLFFASVFHLKKLSQKKKKLGVI